MINFFIGLFIGIAIMYIWKPILALIALSKLR